MTLVDFDCASLSWFKSWQFVVKRYSWLSFLLWIIMTGSAQAAVELRVAIKNGVNQLKVGSSTPAIIRDDSGRQVGEIKAMTAFYAQSKGSTLSLNRFNSRQLWIEPTGEGHVWIGDRWYRGTTQIVAHNNRLMGINHVDLEDYLYSVVGAEMIPSWHQDALKSQAVAARTYALYKSAKSKSPFFDLDTTTNTQVYKGLNSETNTTHNAVNTTEGQVLTHNGQMILAVFHSSSGGHTENVEDIWSNPLPYLRGVIDYDQNAPVYRWTKQFSRGELTRKIGGVGTVKSLVPERRTPQGRIITLRVVGDRGTKRLSGNQLRQALGLRSTLFTVSSTGSQIQISGRGFGHGVGLSQWGAQNLAQRGIHYQEILSHYYQNADLSVLPQD